MPMLGVRLVWCKYGAHPWWPAVVTVTKGVLKVDFGLNSEKVAKKFSTLRADISEWVVHAVCECVQCVQCVQECLSKRTRERVRDVSSLETLIRACHTAVLPVRVRQSRANAATQARTWCLHQSSVPEVNGRLLYFFKKRQA